MTEIDIARLVPGFIIRDKNGYAMAKAIEAGMKYFRAKAEAGAGAVTDPAKMPEWRLDEMAWEYNVPYDYTAEIGIKRGIIENAYIMHRLYGTNEGLKRYLEAVFTDARTEEAWEYGGEPYHFRVRMGGELTEERKAWFMATIDSVKNLRSALDGVTVEIPKVVGEKAFYCGAVLYLRGQTTGMRAPAPDMEDGMYLRDENGDYLSDEEMIMIEG